MVNEFIESDTSTHLDKIFVTSPQAINAPGTRRLSWKFFDNSASLDEQRTCDEDGDIPNNYAEELNSTDGLLLLSNSNLCHSASSYHPFNYQDSPSVMNTSSSSTGANNTNHNHTLPHKLNHHQNHHQIQNRSHHQTNNNSNGLNNKNFSENHNSGNTGGASSILRHDAMMTGGSGVGGSTAGGSTSGHGRQIASSSSSGAIAHATGVVTSAGNTADSDMMMGGEGFHFGLYGWRKKCLYILILGLMVLIVVNLVLTLWILKVMEFSSEGMGQLRIVAGGIQLTGQAMVLDLLRASTIRSRHGQPISIESSRNFSINTRDSEGFIENHLFLGHDRLECLATGFRINDTHGGNLFSVNRNEVAIGAHTLRIDGDGGAIFRDSVQTSHVRADAGRELRLESPTRQLEMFAAQDLTLQSRAGNLEVNALKEIRLNSIAGSIRLDSTHIILSNLKTVQPTPVSSEQNRQHNQHTHKVYQLCACANGKLFLASPYSICAGDDTTICR